MNSLRRGKPVNLLTTMKNLISSGATMKPLWFDAMVQFPPPIPRPHGERPKEIHLDEDKLVEELKQVIPEIGSYPLRFVPGSARYFTHPLMYYATMWKTLMDKEKLSREDAFEVVLDDVGKQQMYDALLKRVHTQQALDKGVSLTNYVKVAEAKQRAYDITAAEAEVEMSELARARLKRVAEMVKSGEYAKITGDHNKLDFESIPTQLSPEDRDEFFEKNPELLDAFNPSVTVAPHTVIQSLRLERKVLESLGELQEKINTRKDLLSPMSIGEQVTELKDVALPTWVNIVLKRAGVNENEAREYARVETMKYLAAEALKESKEDMKDPALNAFCKEMLEGKMPTDTILHRLLNSNTFVDVEDQVVQAEESSVPKEKK